MTKPLTGAERADLERLSKQTITWEKLLALDTATDELAPDEMTPAMYAKKANLSVSRASTRLLQYYREGKLTRRKMRNHGWAYRVAK